MKQARRGRKPRGAAGGGGSSSWQRKFDPALMGLIGEANVQFVKGNTDKAVRMCLEVIEHDYKLPDPYQTLSIIFETEGDHEKALQFSLIAAYLAPQDHVEWSRLADMSLEMNDFQQAVTCLRKGEATRQLYTFKGPI